MAPQDVREWQRILRTRAGIVTRGYLCNYMPSLEDLIIYPAAAGRDVLYIDAQGVKLRNPSPRKDIQRLCKA